MANKKATHETEDITLTLHKYNSFDQLIADMQTPPTLDMFNPEKKWVGSGAELGVPSQMSLSDFRITTDYSYTLTLGANTWKRIDYYTRFGIPMQMWVNNEVLTSDLPWTVWFHEPTGDEKYGKYATFCGRIFKTEEEAQNWLDEQSIDEA